MKWLDDELLLAVATENNLSEAALFVRQADHYELAGLRRCEVNYCGYAMLASAGCIDAIFLYLDASRYASKLVKVESCGAKL